MYKLPDNTVILSYTYEEVRRFKVPDLQPHESKLWYMLPEEYKDWHEVSWWRDEQRERFYLVLTKDFITVWQEVHFDESGEPYITESLEVT